MTLPDEDRATLGKKHNIYNKLVQDAITNKKKLEKTFTAEKCDTENLMKIDIACHNKDIDYILSVLKSDDMLYVSRAIKLTPWLADDQYEHIINPEYLNNELFPQMTTKASLKLVKHIRHYLKTERRVEDFYNYETNPIKAEKWLSRCSISFIIAHIDKHMYGISNLEYKRLCEKSVTIFEASMKTSMGRSEHLKAASFLLHKHAEKYMDVFESTNRYSRPRFGPKTTALIMEHTPDRVKNNFFMYIHHIHVPTFVKYIKREDIANFLFNLTNKENEENAHHFRKVFHFNIVKHFVKKMPKAEQFEFVKKVFLDNNVILIKEESLQKGTEMYAIQRICTTVCATTPNYHWYVFAPFDTALNEIKKLMLAEPNINEKYSMLKVLLNCADSNTKHIVSTLKYFSKNHLNDDLWRKRDFVSDIISRTEIYKNDEETWNTFMDIFKILNVHSENDNSQRYIEVTILYHILHDKELSEAISKEFSFNTFKEYRSKLNKTEQNKMFEYLFNYIVNKIHSQIIQSEDKFRESIRWHDNLLDLLKDYNKSISEYPVILDMIKNLIQIRKDNEWKTDLSTLYTKQKSWKRLMFEESLILNPSQEVCVNALKHDPELLIRYKSNVEVLCCDDSMSLEQLLKKIRIYWSESLGDSFTKSYVNRLGLLGGHKALIRGLFTLLPAAPASEIITKYAPREGKIDWNNIDELTLSLQRCIAKNMHIGRPQPSADAILLYAKGDFLQYALPSLLAIFYNMSLIHSQEHIPKLLNAPVSLQKHGLRFAFIKLKHDELKGHLARIWKTTKNTTIRAVTFVLLFKLLCKEKDKSRADELWEILEVFIDNLSFDEDKKIYEKLPNVENVPFVIQPKLLIKSYKFLKTLLPHAKNERGDYEYSIERLATYTRDVMEYICPDFVANLITEFLNEKFFNGEVRYLDDGMLKVVSSYVLCATDEDTQNKRYERILGPLIKRCIAQWNDTRNEIYFIRNHFQSLLTCFSQDLQDYVIEKKKVIPTKIFNNIKNVLTANLAVPQNYTMLTMWKLIVKLTELIGANDQRADWDEVCSKIFPEYGTFCLEVLKEDVKLYFSCIYILYCKVLNMAIKDILPDIVSLQIFELILKDAEFIQAFLVTVKVFSESPYYWSKELEGWKKRESEIRKTIRMHPSVEVKMHYYSAFKAEANDDNDVIILNK